jgi:predicted RNase H-like nuclease (RuvC/YqgF family)
MNKKYCAALLVASLVIGSQLLAQTPKADALSAITSAMASMEMMNGDILKVYSAEENGAKYLAYVVSYKGNEVVVADVMQMGEPKKVGDKINFATQQLEMPPKSGRKVLQFVVMPGSPK